MKNPKLIVIISTLFITPVVFANTIPQQSTNEKKVAITLAQNTDDSRAKVISHDNHTLAQANTQGKKKPTKKSDRR